MDIQEFSIDIEKTRAEVYARKQLGTGRPIAQMLEKKIQEQNGKYSLLGGDHGGNLESGGLDLTNDPKDSLIRLIEYFLSKDTDSVVFFNHANGRLTDPWLREANLRVAHWGEDLYYFCQKTEGVEEIESALINSDSSWTHFGFITKTDMVLSDRESLRIDPNTAENLVFNCSIIFFGAFDGEGYLLWTRI